MRYVPLGDTFSFKFTTRDFDTGAPQTLGGTPAISAYEDDSLTEITAGITLTTNFDSRTGLNQVSVVATGANGYEEGKYYAFVITTGTVDGVSVVGEVVHEIVVGPVDSNTVQWDGDKDAVKVNSTSNVPDVAAVLVDTGGIDSNSYAAGAITNTAIASGAITASEAPNLDATVSSRASAADLDTLISRIGVFTGTGVNTVLGFFQALMRSDGTNPSDLGGTYDAAADSTQAIRDRGDAAWTTGSGLTSQQVRDAMKLSPTAGAPDAGSVDKHLDDIIALLDDPRTEPGQGTPPVSADMVTKMDYIYKWARNKSDNDGSVNQFYASNGSTVDQKQNTSEAAGVVTVDAMTSGP